MKTDLIIAVVCAAFSAAALAFVFVKATLGATGGMQKSGTSSVRMLLAALGLFVERRRVRDVQLDRELQKLEKLVVQSGGKFLEGATASEVFVARFVFPVLALAVIIPVGLMLRLPGMAIMLAATFFGVLLYAYPGSGLKAAAEERTRTFTHDLPSSLDVMRLVAQSGGDLLSAIRAVIEVTQTGPVRDELARVVAEVAIGTSLSGALNNVARRIGTNEANAVFSTLAQSLEMGTSVTDNLMSASKLIRHSSRVKAQAQAQKAVVNMSFPLLLLILPGVFIVLFAPLVIQFINR